MKASLYTRYGSPDVLSIEEVARPTPAEGDVLVKSYATAVTAADSAALMGDPFMARLYFGLRRPKWPILGGEFAGEVEAVGSAVTEFAVGDQVYGSTGVKFAAHAEYVRVPETAVIAPKPQALDYGEAVAIFDGAMTALPFLRDEAQLKAGQSILINGASGSMGTAAVQLAKHFGAVVTGVCSTSNVQLVTSLGAHRVIDYTREDFTAERAKYDVVFDAVGKSSFSRSKRSLKAGGIYLTTVPTVAILVQMPWTRLFGRKRAAIAFTGLRDTKEMVKDLRYFTTLVEKGALVPVIHERVPIERIADAYRLVASGHKKGNVVVTLQGIS